MAELRKRLTFICVPLIHTGTAVTPIFDALVKVTEPSFVRGVMQMVDLVCGDKVNFSEMACKSCQCLENSLGFKCSIKFGCSAPTEVKQLKHDPDRNDTRKEKPCPPLLFFHHYCNTCACSADGRNIACTVKSCPPNMFNIDGSLSKNGLNTDIVRNKEMESIYSILASAKQKLMGVPIKE
ncbi:pacifastin-like protease inhibitor cvp4 [Aphidius gifuensis]|uniref:pacifastin-like protease inhibitor cvp4 n=1 Tax=Aphidius gifuensis TaxID=684658 RepID=UPI001CDD6D3D|nr:pacifastin-like protease inhibitor cvp4 [Aphidius gifuensis]